MKRQLYNLYTGWAEPEYADDYDSQCNVVLDGPADVDLSALREHFNSEVVGLFDYPAYNGPDADKYRGCRSGGIDMEEEPESLTHKVWREGYDLYCKRYNGKKDRLRRKYPGESDGEMFVSWLKVEKGFKEVKTTAFQY